MPPSAPPGTAAAAAWQRATTGAASNGIRGAYESLGVQGFYQTHGHEYSNPHNEQIVEAVAALMSGRDFGEGRQPGEQIRVLDLACGSGEATLALQAWAGQAQQAQQGPSNPQQQEQQPQQKQQQRRPRRRTGGTGPEPPPPLLDVTACDPYTYEAYQRRTGCSAHRWSFQDIADGCLAGRSFHLCVCSFALHLCDPSSLFITLYQLSCHCRWLAILAPHKQPAVRAEHGWAAAHPFKVERVHVRLYSSLNWGQGQE